MGEAEASQFTRLGPSASSTALAPGSLRIRSKHYKESGTFRSPSKTAAPAVALAPTLTGAKPFTSAKVATRPLPERHLMLRGRRGSHKAGAILSEGDH